MKKSFPLTPFKKLYNNYYENMFITINNIKYHYTIIGQGEPIFCLHGFSEDGTTFDFFRDEGEAFLDEFSFISLDLVGHGQSEKPHELKPYQLECILNDLHVFIESLLREKFSTYQKASLLGYSLGGRIALHYALKYPTFIKALILESANYGMEENSAEEIVLKQNRKEADERLAQTILKKGIDWFEAYWSQLSIFDSQKKLPQDIQENIRKRRLQNAPHALAYTLQATGQGTLPSVKDSIKTLSMPIFYICGSLDEKYKVVGQELLRLNPLIKECCVEDAGHNVHAEKSVFYCACLQNFLE